MDYIITTINGETQAQWIIKKKVLFSALFIVRTIGPTIASSKIRLAMISQKVPFV